MTPHRARARWIAVLVAAVCAAGAVALRLAVYDGFDWPDGLELELRGLRAVAALAVGSALSVSGVLLQATMRNDLASPWVLGLTSGAGLGVAVWAWATDAGGTYSTPVLPAILGACGALALVYGISRRRGVLDPATLILVGVMVSVVCGALTGFMQHLTPGAGLERYVRWMLGELNEGAGWPTVWAVLGAVVIGAAVSVRLGRALDAASLGDDEAASVGVSLFRLRLVAMGLAGVLTGATILVAGPIGFVGLVCPHLARMLVGASHRWVVVVSALAGGCLLVGADALVALFPTDAGRIPLGVVTALVGAPVFVVLLKRRGLAGGGS